MTPTTGYAPGSPRTGPAAAALSDSRALVPTGQPGKQKEYWPLTRLKKAYSDYVGNKREELDEQKQSRRYYHGSHWTDEQLKELRKRRQPAVTYNEIARKINGVVGLVERLKNDPKAYPRTPQHEQGADLATAVVRYVMDAQEWNTKRSWSVSFAGIDGIGGIELELETGDRGDKDVGFKEVDPEEYFYDPRSKKPDFSDATFEGVAKWIDLEVAKDMFPEHADALEASTSDADLTSGGDSDLKWFAGDSENMRRVRMVDLWYKHGEGRVCWATFTGALVLMEGESPFYDEKGKQTSKFVMFSANVDQDGDRYSFIRNLKSLQDEVNHRGSKGLHILNSRRLIMSQGAVNDVERARREWARPDGVLMVNGAANEAVKTDDQMADFAGQLKLQEFARDAIANYGYNAALIGQDVKSMSGRAINLQQQAGIAELGPFMVSYKGWTLRVYRAVWNAVQRHWTAERWVRVTDDEDIAQFIQVNGVGIDPRTGQPALVNALGNLDVDIILDEGPDTVNLMGDAYDTLEVMASKGAQVPLPLLLELSPLPGSVKKRLREIAEQAAQAPNQQLQAEMQGKQAELQGQMQMKQMEVEAKQGEMQAQAQIKAAEQQQNAELEAAKLAQKTEHDRRMAEIEVWKTNEKLTAETIARSQQANIDRELEIHKINAHAAADVAKNERNARHDSEMKDRELAFNKKNNPETVKSDSFRSLVEHMAKQSQTPRRSRAKKVGNGEWVVEDLIPEKTPATKG